MTPTLVFVKVPPGLRCPRVSEARCVAFPNSYPLNFRNMTDEDLEDMAEMPSDPAVMAFYPRPRRRRLAEA